MPLLDTVNNLEILDIFSIPKPIKNPNIPDYNWPNIVAWYTYKAYLIAVNLGTMKYSLKQKGTRP